MADSKRKRADELLANTGLVDSRNKAHSLIMMGAVSFRYSDNEQDWKKVSKAGQQLLPNAEFNVVDPTLGDVSRGAKKLRDAIDHWGEINLNASFCLDIGSSTGGFTQVCLQKGATKVVAIDVGTHQLHERLRKDKRVALFENQHVLQVEDDFWKKNQINPFFDFICTDVSFISVKKIIQHGHSWLRPGGSWVILIKPQFELESKKVPKGIVREEKYRLEAINKIVDVVRPIKSLKWVSLVPCSIKGTEGNQEYLLWLKKSDS